ncbi:MAG: response regulator transcription factor [Phycisphaerae bacterium]|nr:response regulator transcription factor [Phycisphaerae bacterium]
MAIRPQPILIYLVGGSDLDRAAYSSLLRHELGLEVAIHSDFAATAVWDALRKKPQLVLVDADTASGAAIDAINMIPRLTPEARILLISAAVEPVVVRGWSGCRMHGYVIKDGGVPELRMAIEAVLADREYFSVGIRPLLEAGPEGSGVIKLSRRESELLPLLARGLSLRDAASQMAVSYKTAESYRTSLLRKVGARDRVELARFAIRNGIVEP